MGLSWRFTHNARGGEPATEGLEPLGGGDLSGPGNDISGQDHCVLDRDMRTRLMKTIRSSGTPCSLSTSTALIAEPPVAVEVYEYHGTHIRTRTYLALGLGAAHIAVLCLVGTIHRDNMSAHAKERDGARAPWSRIASAEPSLRPAGNERGHRRAWVQTYPLDENLANAHAATDLPETCLHRLRAPSAVSFHFTHKVTNLACPQDGHATNLPLKANTFVDCPLRAAYASIVVHEREKETHRWCLDCLWDYWQVV